MLGNGKDIFVLIIVMCVFLLSWHFKLEGYGLKKETNNGGEI
jgi:hypothetical protein